MSHEPQRAPQPVDLTIASDTTAFEQVTAHDMPDITATSAWLERAGRVSGIPRRRPLRWAALVTAAAVALLLALIPVTYTRTLHYEVVWTQSRPGSTPQAHVRPVVEHRTGSVLAMAMDRVLELRIHMRGHTPMDIERDLRHQLERGGLPAVVRVERDSGGTEIRVHATRAPGGAVDDVHVSLDGMDSTAAKVLRYSPDPRKSDAEIAAELESLLRARGFDAQVVVRGGHVVSIERRR